MAYRRATTGGREDGISCNVDELENFEVCTPGNESPKRLLQSPKMALSSQKMNDMVAGVPKKWWNIATYISAASFLASFYTLATDSSCLLTLASALQCFGVLGLFGSQHSLHSLTAKLYIFSWGFRTFVIIFSKGYTPVDATGDWLHTVIELTSLCLMIFAALEDGLKRNSTSLINYGEWKMTACLVATALTTGYFFHISLVGYNKVGVRNQKYIYDILWAASTYLELVAMLPHVYRMAIEKNTQQNAQFVFMSFMSRSVGLAFWILVHPSVVRLSESILTPYLVTGAQVVQLISISEVTYFYVKEQLRKAKEILTQDFISTMV